MVTLLGIAGGAQYYRPPMATPSITTARALRDWIRWAETALDDAGVYFGHGTDNALDEAAWLAGGALGISPAQLETRLDDVLDEAQATALRALIERRIRTRLPTAYLLREAWFAGLPFYVDERVIVPRSLTGEFIVDQFSPWIDATRVQRLLDLGTGSGCMAIACAYAFPDAHIDATDVSPDALAVARINVERHHLTERVRLRQSDLFGALAGERYEVILTNPPYVSPAEMPTLPEEYRHEPPLALVSGTDGLQAITRILSQASDYLASDGVLIAEVGNSHAPLQQTFPDVPFVWLTAQNGDESVFLLSADELAKHRARFSGQVR
jgi:ribosomal protein L3 glutamine methyltransferase